MEASADKLGTCTLELSAGFTMGTLRELIAGLPALNTSTSTNTNTNTRVKQLA